MTTPHEVWALIERADELVKYARNRDPGDAYERARRTLDEAEAALPSLDPATAERFRAQIETRRNDLAAAGTE